jgi:undecaprenyl-diphosphatase
MMINYLLFIDLFSLTHRSPLLDWLIIFCANGFGYIMVFVAFVYLIFYTDGNFDFRALISQFKNKFKDVFFVFSASIGAWIIATLIKMLVVSPRPFILFDAVQPLFVTGGLESFPSGHAMFFSALAMSLYFIRSRMGYLYFVVALIVGLARVAGGVHFPLDILAGYIFGVIVAIICRYIFKLIFRNK